MRITTQGDYGLRCMINIAKNGPAEPVSIQRIAKDEGLPRTYVEQLLLKLRRSGLIKSVRGTRGGYLLARSPQSINMKEIIEALEGNVFEIVCERRSRSRTKCKYDGTCALNGVWHSLRDRVTETLEHISLEQLVDEEQGK